MRISHDHERIPYLGHSFILFIQFVLLVITFVQFRGSLLCFRLFLVHLPSSFKLFNELRTTKILHWFLQL